MMTTRSVSSPRFRLLLLALGIALAIPTLSARAQDPDQVPAPDQTERKTDEARTRARQAREAELKALAEQIRQKREAIEAEEARERRDAEAQRADAERERAKLQAEVSNRQADLLLLDLRIEATQDALKAVWKRIMEVELQRALQDQAPDASRDDRSLAVLKRQADSYEQQIRECIARKVQLAREAQDAERGLSRARVRVNRPATTTRSVAEGVDRLLGHLSEQGALDDHERDQLGNAVGALEELIDLFRDYHRGSGKHPRENPDHGQQQDQPRDEDQN